MPYYGDSSSYYYGGSSFSNHSSLMSGIGRPLTLSSRFAPHLSTISESPLSSMRLYSPSSHVHRKRIIDTSEIDVTTPRTLSSTVDSSRIRRDRPTIKIRSQALKDNPALREHTEKHERTMGELLMEKFLIKDKSDEKVQPTKLYRQVSLDDDRVAHEPPPHPNHHHPPIPRRVTRRQTRRKSSADIQMDPQQLLRELAYAQAQSAALDSLVAEEQAEIEDETRKGTLIRKFQLRGRYLRVGERHSDGDADDEERIPIKQKQRRHSSIDIIDSRKSVKVKKTKKRQDKSSASCNSGEGLLEEEDEDQLLEKRKKRKSKRKSLIKEHRELAVAEAACNKPSETESDAELAAAFSQKIKVEARNSVGDFSTLLIDAAKRDVSAEVVLPILPKAYVRDSSRNSAYLTMKAKQQQQVATPEAIDHRRNTVRRMSTSPVIDKKFIDDIEKAVNQAENFANEPLARSVAVELEGKDEVESKRRKAQTSARQKPKAEKQQLPAAAAAAPPVNDSNLDGCRRETSEPKVPSDSVPKPRVNEAPERGKQLLLANPAGKTSDVTLELEPMAVKKNSSKVRNEGKTAAVKSDELTKRPLSTSSGKKNIEKEVLTEAEPIVLEKDELEVKKVIEPPPTLEVKGEKTKLQVQKLPPSETKTAGEEILAKPTPMVAKKDVIPTKTETLEGEKSETQLKSAKRDDVPKVQLVDSIEAKKNEDSTSNEKVKVPKQESLSKVEPEKISEKKIIAKPTKPLPIKSNKSQEEPPQQVPETKIIVESKGKIQGEKVAPPTPPVGENRLNQMISTEKKIIVQDAAAVPESKVVNSRGATVQQDKSAEREATTTSAKPIKTKVKQDELKAKESKKVTTSTSRMTVKHVPPQRQKVIKKLSGDDARKPSSSVDDQEKVLLLTPSEATTSKAAVESVDSVTTSKKEESRAEASSIPSKNEDSKTTQLQLSATAIDNKSTKKREANTTTRTEIDFWGEIKTGDSRGTNAEVKAPSAEACVTDGDSAGDARAASALTSEMPTQLVVVEKQESIESSSIGDTLLSREESLETITSSFDEFEASMRSSLEQISKDSEITTTTTTEDEVASSILPVINVVEPASPLDLIADEKRLADALSKICNHDEASVGAKRTTIGEQRKNVTASSDNASTPVVSRKTSLASVGQPSIQDSKKKKKLVKRKKSGVPGEASQKKGTLKPKPIKEETLARQKKSSPRPEQRPKDLAKIFYTTPSQLLTATPRDLSKVTRAKVKARKKHSSRTPSVSSDSTGSTCSSQTSASSASTEFEGNVENKRTASMRSNDSGFDGSPRLSNCDMACHKKCEKLTGHLCGLNQKLVAEALQLLKKAPASHTSDAHRHSDDNLHGSGRITPPATNLPRFKKYTVTDFNFLKVLGKGSFGKVLLAELRGSECFYAVKCLKKDVVLEDDDVECTLIERKVLTLATRHPYLCHLFCTFQTDSHLFFVMEYLNGGDLMFHIQKSGRFPEQRARFYAAEIWSGLNFLHKKGIVYRDLKLDNVLLDFEGHIRIADFGMCKLQIFLDRTADTFCGTPDYMAPEVIKGLKYNQAVDWWSFGVLLYEMLTGQSPFSGCDEDELFWSICNERPFIPRYLSQVSTDLLVSLLEKDSTKRLPGHDIATHPFFHSLPWDKLERRQVEPPFKPSIEHTLDTRYFDTAFTAERPRLTPVPETILTSMDQSVFRGFSYTNPNATD